MTREGLGETGKVADGVWAKSLALKDFRNYDQAEVDWAPGFNVLTGQNAQGKTNLLEAVYLASTTRLLRPGRDADAIKSGKQQALAKVRLGHVETEISVRLSPGVAKSVLLNGIKLPRASDVLGRLPTVCITTLDLEIIRGEPAERRLFLDLDLSQAYPAYLRELGLYKRALEHRNALLRRAADVHVSEEEFGPWEAQMAESGAKLRQARIRYVEALSPVAEESQSFMGGEENLSVRYAPKDEAIEPDRLLELLESSRGEEVRRGASLVGPHRDDLTLELDGKPARIYGSQGQQRTAVIALKLASLQVGESSGNPKSKTQNPKLKILLLDDILSDLDTVRRERLVQWILDHAGQAILTCTDGAAAGPKLIKSAKIFTIENGTIAA